MFFVDAVHFVLGAFLSVVWCLARVWIKAPSGRQRFNVLGDLDAMTKDVMTVVNSAYIHSLRVCALLEKLATLTSEAMRPASKLTAKWMGERWRVCSI